MDFNMASVAIVGVSCALPSGVHSDRNLDYDTLWDFLLSKKDAYDDIPADRFNIDAWHGQNLGQIKTTKGAFLKDSTVFDHLEFGIPYQEAISMSPSTRHLIEQSFLALLDSGVDFRGQNIGCYMSGTNPGLIDQDEYDQSGSFGGIPTMVANRVSYALDITGPSISLDTACSSSLTATHLAVQSILSGECDTALAGGCQYNHSILEWVNYSRAGVLAPDGKSKPFDAGGDGFGRGEGVVVIVLKRLHDALRDHDKIYATILGSAINSTGSAYAPYVPVGSAQQYCIRRAFERAHRPLTDIDYLELHATGTSVGDPIEANAAGQIFKRDRVLPVGSLKGNLGHLEISAFLASLAKVCLMFERRMIPPQANLETRNPAILWQKYNLDASKESKPLPKRDDEARGTLIGISSFGIGGSNGHVVLEAPPSLSPDEDVAPSLHSPLLLLAGGLSPRSATEIAASIKETIHEKSEDLALLSYSWGRRARQMTWRTFAVYRPGAELKFSNPVLVPRERPACIFVLSGQGPQYVNMGRLLYQSYRVFRDSIDEMDAVFEATTGSSLIATTGLFRATASPKSPLTDSWPIAVTLPALAMYQCALIDLMKSVGVVPDAVVGHSAGETSLLYACGAAPKAMVVELAIARGSAMSVLEKEHGTMAAISCVPDTVKKLFVEVGDADGRVEIACYNAPEAVSISGSRATIEKVVKLATDCGIFARVLRTNTPVHSSLMERCRDIYVEAIRKVFARYNGDCRPTIPTYSTVTGQRHLTAFTPEYFWVNARQPVEFVKAMEEIHASYANKAVIIEISPHPVLSAYVTSISGLKPLAAASRPSRDGRRSESTAFLECLGQLSLSGYNSIDLHELTGVSGGLCPPLRSYPFTRRRVPFHAASPTFFARLKPRNGPLCHAGLRISKATHPELADHVIHGQAIMPAAGFLEMAFEMGGKQLYDVQFLQALPLTQERPVLVEVVLHDSSWDVKTTPQASVTGPGFGGDESRIHARGRLSLSGPASQDGTFDVKSTVAKCTKVDIPGFMSALRSFSTYGPAFSRIQDLYESQEEVIAIIRGPSSEERLLQPYHIEPSVVDAAFQACYQFLRSVVRTGDVYYLPAGCGHITLSEGAAMCGLPATVVARIVFKAWTPAAITFDITLFSEVGDLLMSLTSFELERHLAVLNAPESLQRFDWCWQPVWMDEIASDVEVESTSLACTDPDISVLYDVLDESARQMIMKTLRAEPSVVPIDWQRYLALSNGTRSNNGLEVRPANLRERWPAHFAITEHLASVHSGAGISSEAVIKQLYSGGAIAEFYSELRQISPICSALTQRFEDTLAQLIAKGKRVIRVLEIGTGTGSLTSCLEPILRHFPDTVIEYICTDVNPSYVLQTMDRLSNPQLSAHAYDIGRRPDEQGLKLRSFDIITGSFILHAASDLDFTINCLKDLLVPGGELMFVDLDGAAWPNETGTLWLDFVFGSFKEWFSFSGKREHYALSLEQWRTIFDRADLQTLALQKETNIGIHFLAHVRKGFADIAGEISGAAVPDDILFFHLQSGEEDSLRQYLHDLDRTNMLTLWLCTSKHPNGYAMLGLGRSLSKEYPDWDVHVAIFDACESHGEREAVIKKSLPFIQFEPEVFFDQTAPRVGRIVPSTSPSPSPKVSGDQRAFLFDPSRSYLLLGGLGGLGIRIAAWMYERGARSLILTSRSGVATIRRQKEHVIPRILDYLSSLADLNLRLEASDATSPTAVEALVHSISPPLAGCMVMTAVLADGLFSSQTNDDFTRAFEAKCAPFRLLAKSVDIESLEFCIAFSSVAGLFGNGGQTNYASACTALDAMTEPYSRAFSLIVPGVTDVGMFARGMEKHSLASAHLAEWGMTSDELCEYIEDGIISLRSGHLTHYIPNLDWAALGKSMGVQPSFAHLVPKTSFVKATASAESEQRTALHVIQEFLQLAPEDFSPDVPFTHYGLDSLRAVRLSAALRPFGNVSQLQLLADMRFRDLEELLSQAQPNTEERPPLGSSIARLGEAISDDTVVKLHEDDSTVPLIMIHGGGGSIQPFNMLKDVYGSALWAIQVTPETPLSSIELMSQFYFRKIKEQRPHGPYRIGTFSASSVVGLYLAKLFERAGDEVVQLAILDHFPLILFAVEGKLADTIAADGGFTPAYSKWILESMSTMLRLDARLPGRDILAEGLTNLARGGEAPQFVCAFRDRLVHFMLLTVKYVLGSSSDDASVEEDFARRISGLKAPISLYIASDGIGRTIAEERLAPYTEFGIRRCYPDARIHRFSGGHFDLLANKEVARALETEWLEGGSTADAEASTSKDVAVA